MSERTANVFNIVKVDTPVHKDATIDVTSVLWRQAQRIDRCKLFEFFLGWWRGELSNVHGVVKLK